MDAVDELVAVAADEGFMALQIWAGLGVPEDRLGPTLLPREVRLCGSGIPYDDHSEGHLLWDSALYMARSSLLNVFFGCSAGVWGLSTAPRIRWKVGPLTQEMSHRCGRGAAAGGWAACTASSSPAWDPAHLPLPFSNPSGAAPAPLKMPVERGSCSTLASLTSSRCSQLIVLV